MKKLFSFISGFALAAILGSTVSAQTTSATVEKLWSKTTTELGATVNDTRQGIGRDGVVYLLNKANQSLVAVSAEGQDTLCVGPLDVAEGVTASLDGTACTLDDAGNFVIEGTFPNIPSHLVLRKADGSIVKDYAIKGLARTDYITATGDVFSAEGGHVFLYGNNANLLIYKVAEGVLVGDPIEVVGVTNGNNNNVISGDDKTQIIHHRTSQAGWMQVENGSESLIEGMEGFKNTTMGGDIITLAGKEFYIYPTGTTNYNSEFCVRNMTDGVFVVDKADGSTTSFTPNSTEAVSSTIAACWLSASKIDDNNAYIHVFNSQGVAVYKLSVSTPVDTPVETPSDSYVIKYTSSDGNIVTPYASDVFGVNIVSNTYSNGQGVITFDGPVTSIGEDAFYGCSSLTSITIPNSVTSIGESAFEYCSSLTSITIPNSVTSTGRWAFSSCSSLTSMVVEEGNTTYDSRDNCNAIIKTATNTLIAGCQNTIIPNSVTSIGWDAFSGCTSLNSVTIPNSVTSIGICAFSDCSSLTSITIPNSVTSIGGWAFMRCSSLTSVTIGNSVTSIGESAFSVCSSLTSITIPNSVTSIGREAFNGTAIYKDESNWKNDVLYIDNCLIVAKTSISGVYTIKENTRLIAGYAFSSCSSLTSITIPNSVTSIGWRAFYGCSSLNSVTIPNSVTSIGAEAFSDCSSIESIFCYSNTPPSIQYSTFSQYNATLYVPSSTPYKNHSVWGNFEKIVSMGNEMIFTHDGLYYKTISSESIISLSLLTQENFNKFTPISLIGSQNWRYDSKYGATMNGYQNNVTHQNEDWLISPALDLSKHSSATLEFSHAFGPKASVPSTADQKAQYTCWISNDFNGDVATATWTELPITYGTSAWSYITTTVDIPAENLKENCRIAWKYVCDDESATWEINGVNVTGAPIQQVEVISGPNKYSGDIVVPATVTMNDTVYNVVAIGTEAFYNCSSLTSLAIPNSIKRIGTNAIVGTSSLTAITLTAPSIEEYCNGALNKLLWQLGYIIPRILQINENKLSEIIIPETVSEISDYAFYNCSSLTSITLPNSIKSIGNHAFYECASLEDISIPNSVTTLGQSVFENCISLKSAYVGNGITSLDSSTFLGCSSLKSVTLGGRIVHIGESVFSGCTALNEITLPASVKSIGENAFAGCTKLYDIYCFAMEAPTAYESSFANYNAFLHVPCDNQRVYLLDVIFGNFKYIECIEAETTPTDTIVVTPSFNDAEFIWPSNSSADSYTLAISKDGEIFCTLTFNANGQLTGIAFAPSRNGQHNAPAAAQTANGFAFTVTGLDEGSNYTYELLIQDRSGNTLQSYSGEFRTQSTNDRTVTVEYDAAQGQVTGAGTYLVGDTVTLTAIPNDGYRFVRWSNEVVDNPYTFVISDDVTISAEFEKVIATSIEHTHSQSPMTDCQKIIHNGQLLILRDGKIYTVMGQEL